MRLKSCGLKKLLWLGSLALIFQLCFTVFIPFPAAADSVTAEITTGTNPTAMALNPVSNKLYIANTGSGSVTVVNSASESVSTTVSVGTEPVAVAVNPTVNKVYVACRGSGDVYIIDGASDTVKATVAVGAGPSALAVNPVTNKVYVANKGGNSVTVIDGVTDGVPSTIAVGTAPAALVVNPVANKIYVANSGSGNDNGTLTVINGATDNVIKTIGVGKRPAALAVNPVTDRVYVANSGSNNVGIIYGSSNSMSTQIGVGNSPNAVAVNPVTNRIYVSNQGKVTVINGETNQREDVTIGNTLGDIAINTLTDQVYVINKESYNLARLTGEDNTLGSIGGGLSLSAIIVDSANNKVYAASGEDDRVVVITETSRTMLLKRLETTIDPLDNNISAVSSPTFSLSSYRTSNINTLDVQYIYYQVDSKDGPWLRAVPQGNNGSGTVLPLNIGDHTIYAFATDGQDASFNSGPGGSPLIGKIASYSFKVTGSAGTTETTTSDYGTLEINTNTGGTVSLEGAATVKIPADALPGVYSVKVTVGKAANPPEPPKGLRFAGTVYEINVGSGGVYSFYKPVDLSFSYDKSVPDTDARVEVFNYDETSRQWVNLGGTVNGDTVSVKADRFSKLFAVMTGVKKEVSVDTLTDIRGHWAEDNIRALVKLGAISGLPDGSFEPERTITRAEFATVLVKAFELKPQYGTGFIDTKGHWAQSYIENAASNGILSGYNGEYFGPDDLITHEQMAVAVVKAARLPLVSEELFFVDKNSISPWARDYVATALKEKWITSNPDLTYRPQAKSTRAEAVAIIYNALYI